MPNTLSWNSLGAVVVIESMGAGGGCWLLTVMDEGGWFRCERSTGFERKEGGGEVMVEKKMWPYKVAG